MGFCLYSLPVFHTSFTYNLTKTTTFTRNANMINRHFEGIARSISTVAQYPANNRQLAENYQPSFWSQEYVESIASGSINTKQINKERADKLEEEVRCMLCDEHMEPLTLLELIDDIQRLGLAYRYKKSLAKALDRISVMEGATMGIENSMSAAALHFRLLRQHGYKVSADVLKSFKDRNGSFKACLTKDVKGMLNLYEASHLSFETEDILKDAKTFTTLHLKKLNGNSTTDTRLAEQVNHALEVPFHYGMGMLEARWHINEYSQRPDANPVILELAVLDFNMVQSTLRNDLLHGSRWWSDVGLSKKLRFSRDRLVENFFFAVGIASSEPEFTKVRKGITKVAALITTIDDVYDVYGSVNELDLFTDVVVRWDINGAMKNLPDYMKICFLALYNAVHELAYDTLKEQNKMVIPHLTKAWADLCKAFLQEAKWRHHRCTSLTFEDFLENAWISVSGVVILLHAYFLAGHNITNKSMKYLENTTSNYHDLLRCPSMIFRLYNDLSSSKAEIKRGETINTISCYMRESGHSEEVAREYISNLIDETWKKMNAQLLEFESPFGRSFLETSMNLARITRCIYQYGDDHSDPGVRSRNRISSLIVEPIQQCQTKNK